MSLRSVGNQLLQTVPNALLAGASTASLSLWVRVNAGSNVVNSNGVEIFGDSGGKLSATLSGAGNLLLGWLSHNGTTNGGSSNGLTLVPGTNYHVATVWQNAAQSYYLNGVLVHTDSQVGSIGVAGDSAPHPYRLGSDSAGTDVTLDEPTIWVGYALSAQDVLNLRDRVVPPQNVASASIALQWPLAGADGVAATIGNPGLADSSATHLNLSSIVGAAPTYQAGVLSYYPSVAATIAPSGESIVLQCQDGSGNPANVISFAPISDVQTITQTGSAAGGEFTLSFNGQTTAPILTPQTNPPTAGLWAITTIVGHAYSLAATWKFVGSPYGQPNMAFEILDGSQSILSPPQIIYRNEAYAPSEIDDGQTHSSGSEVYWDTIGTFTATGTTYYVRCTADNPSGQWYIDGLRVQDTTVGGSPTYHDDQDGSLTVVPSSASYGTQTGIPTAYLGTETQILASSTSPYYQITGGTATIQAALLALSSVETGGLTVTGSNPFTVTFTGPMADTLQPAITCGDPAITIVHTNPGGNFPSYSVNGGTPILLPEPIANLQPYSTQPIAMWPLFQSSKPVQYGYSGGQRWYGSGFDVELAGGPSLSGQPATGTGGASSTATFTFGRLPAGTYQAAVTWQATGSLSTSVTFELRDGSGTVLATKVVDQAVTPSDILDGGFHYAIVGSHTISPTDANSMLKVVLVGSSSSAGALSIDACRLARTSGDLSVTILDTDTVELILPDNYLTLGSGIGQVPGGTITMANRVGSSLFGPFSDATPTTLFSGYNVEGEGFETPFYANLARRISNPMSPLFGHILAADADGYPTLIDASQIRDIPVYSSGYDPGGNGRGLRGAPNGLYTVLWDWDGIHPASNLQLVPGYDVGVTEETTYANPTGTTDNIRVFNFQSYQAALYSPNIDLDVISVAAPDGSGHYSISLKNLRIYPPNPADPTGMTPWGITQAAGQWVAASPAPPLFHPQLWNHVGDAQCFRFMNLLGTNNCPLVDFADYAPTTNLSRTGPPDAGNYSYEITSSLVSIVPLPEGMDPYFAPAKWAMALVTTDVPNGAYDGAGYVLINATGPSTILTSNGPGGAGSIDFSSFNPVNVHPINATQFIVQCDLNDFSIFTNSLGPDGGFGGTVTCHRGVAMPLEDVVGFCNTAKSVSGHGGDLWWNISPAASDACDASVAAYLAANLGVGQKCYLEYANECWNYSFKPFFFCQTVGYRYDRATTNPTLQDDSGQYPVGYALTMLRKHAIYQAAFVAAGHGTDLVRVLGAFGGSTATGQFVLQTVINLCAPSPPPVDAYATATYVDNVWPGTAIADPRYNTMTVAQQLDHWELMVLGNYYYAVTISDHRSMLQGLATSSGFAALATLPLVNYEASLDFPTANRSREDGFLVGEQIMRHPRIFRLKLADMEAKQAAGTVLSMQFYMDEGIYNQYDGPPDPYGQSEVVAWAAWFGWNQAAGTGNPSENPDPFDMPNVVSQQGGALNRWSSLIAGLHPISGKPKRLIPGRNGQIRTTGFPRGLFRPSR
jgi:Concanavalin A-like lectin/glucanases superfamily